MFLLLFLSFLGSRPTLVALSFAAVGYWSVNLVESFTLNILIASLTGVPLFLLSNKPQKDVRNYFWLIKNVALLKQLFAKITSLRER